MNDSQVSGPLASWSPAAMPNAVPASDHIKWDEFMNGWYVDPAAMCRHTSGCTHNADGSYDMSMIIEFSSQRWFYLGEIISGATLLGVIGYFVYGMRRGKQKVWRIR